MDIAGQHIVIIGGTSGIGLAVAEAASKAGAAVVVASSRDASVAEALARLPPAAKGHRLDIRDEAAIAAFFEGIGEFDHLVFTAGESLQLGAVRETEIAAAKAFFETRYWGAFMTAKHAAPRLRPGGSIVFTSGIAGQRPQTGWALGASICAAMEGLTRALAVELAPLRVNLVSPGFVRSPLWRNMADDARDALYESAGKSLPVGRVGEPADLAEAYLFLMRQGFATGQTMVVDGGGVLV